MSTCEMPSSSSRGISSASAPADGQQKPKPCCVCTTEKQQRDECLLFAPGSTELAEKVQCKDQIQAYRICMEGFGFKVSASQ